MKTRSTIVAGLIVMLTTVFFASNAQTTNPAIKVLPTTKDGIVKLLVVGTTENESVDVKIYSDDGLAATDAIRSNTQGFNKKYDVREIMNRGFVMEVTTAGTAVTYKLAKSKGKLIPHLVKTTYTYPLVASND